MDGLYSVLSPRIRRGGASRTRTGPDGSGRALRLPAFPVLQGATEAERVERGIVIVFSVLRSGLILQLMLSFWFQLRAPGIPAAAPAVTLFAIAFSAVYVGRTLRRRELTSTTWGIADVVTGITMLAVLSQVVPPQYHVGSWLFWVPGYLEQVIAMSPAWMRSVARSLAVGCGMGALYLLFLLPGTNLPSSVIVNSIDYPMFVLASATVTRYARNAAVRADALRAEAEESRRVELESRRQAVEAANALELERYSFHVHNATGLLEAFARTEGADPLLRRQAAQEANRLRHAMLRSRRDDRDEADQGPVSLETVIWDATGEFGHLPLEFSLALGRSARLTPAHARALTSALIALLYNVQMHADASTVTLHADLRDGRWEVSLTDDGNGFHAIPSNFGFGLRSQVIDALQKRGLSVTISSHPGEGTCTTISGPTAS